MLDVAEPILREDTQNENKLDEPHDWAVILLNDDFTTMDFVVEVLIQVFHKDPLESERIMFDVHQKGRGLVGLYAYDIAQTKQQTVQKLAEANEFPLRCIIEEE
jgi:ATP-dependent Clp protease adaptor protein ClpS